MGITLQCELWHIMNIEGWSLMTSDEGLLILTRRENLDAWWGDEPSTVEVNLVYLRGTRRDALEGKLFLYPLPQLGPLTLEYLVGMRPEFLVLQQFPKQGRWKDYLKWDITRSYSSAYGNIWSDGFLQLGSANLEIWDIKMVVTTTPTWGTWFERFMRGNKKLMGSIKRKDFGLLG